MIFHAQKPGLSVEQQEIAVFKSQVKGQRYLYLISGLHGDEFEGIYLLQELFYWLGQEHEAIDIPLIAIPILNVDGYRRSEKNNSRAVDLNTNFDSTKPTQHWEPESQWLHSQLQRFPPGLFLKFLSHGPKVSFLGPALEVASFISKLNTYPLKQDKYIPKHSLGSFVWEQYQCPVVTVQCPKLGEESTLSALWENNQSCLKKLFMSPILARFLFQPGQH